MNISSAYPSKYLKADDLGDKSIVVVIDRVEMETLGQGRDKETKPVVFFKGKEKGLVLNKTNANTISKLYGGETDEWEGKPITIMAREVEMQGDMVMAIRVSLQKPVPKKQGTAPAAAQEPSEEEGAPVSQEPDPEW